MVNELLAVLLCVAFTLPIKLALFQSMGFLTFTLPQSHWGWGLSSSVVLICQLGVMDALDSLTKLVVFWFRLQRK